MLFTYCFVWPITDNLINAECRSPCDSSVHDTVWMTVISASERLFQYGLEIFKN